MRRYFPILVYLSSPLIPNFVISLPKTAIKKTKQLPEYTRNKGLDKAKIQQMIIQYLQNAGSFGAKRDAIFDYLKEVLPQNKTHEQQARMLGNILAEMKENGLIVSEGRTWFLMS